MSESLSRVSSAGKAPAGTYLAAHSAGRGWIVQLDPAFLTADHNGLSAPARVLAIALDGIARLSALAWPSNATLAAMLGVSPRRVQELLVELERAGWISPVYVDGRKRVRLAIVLRRRVGPHTPAVVTDDDLARVVVAVREGRRGDLTPQNGRAGTKDPAQGVREKAPTPVRGIPRQKNSPSSREQPPLEETRVAGSVQRDDRKTIAKSEPASVVSVAETTAREDDRLLARRTPAERERFRQLAPDVQARVLALLGRGDRTARESLRRLLEPVPSSKPTPSTPELPALTFADRCRAMGASGDRRLVSGFASALALGLGSRTDQRFFAEFAKVGERICTGQLSPDVVVDAATAAFRPGVRNPGAYWWTTLQRNATCATGAGVHT